uniref:Zn-dependent hydrolases of the beta-lactamase fold n=1 Tax=Brachypodium sylvaticum TaxID=29664 RepID=C3TX72_BRASY|nr:Zn-dependent hydrolases of the beta-lactamase fold [Brachypodium sylvaticum]
MQPSCRPSCSMAGGGHGLLQLLPLPRPSIFFSRRPHCYSPSRSTCSPRRRHPIIRSTTADSSSSSSTATGTRTRTSISSSVKLTYLEFNGWIWELQSGFRILVDPILVGNLDFGIPWLFDAAKKTLTPADGDSSGAILRDPKVDLLLITQSLDDHCHLRTLKELSAVAPGLPVVTTPNAQPIVSKLPFQQVTYLEPGQSTTVDGGGVTVLATAGPVLGPPWQRPENGYIVTASGPGNNSIYYEPHCVYDAAFLRDRGLRADVLITPVVKQLLPANFTLVSGQEDAVDLARLLRPTYVVPMSNGEFDAKGLLTAVITTQGTPMAFKALLSEALPQAQVMEPTPGVPLHLQFDNTSSSVLEAD